MKKSEAVNYFGSLTSLAKALKITHSSVSQWGDYVPPRRAYELERITKGKLKAFIPGNEQLEAS